MEDARFVVGVLHVDALKGPNSLALSAQIWIR